MFPASLHPRASLTHTPSALRAIEAVRFGVIFSRLWARRAVVPPLWSPRDAKGGQHDRQLCHVANAPKFSIAEIIDGTFEVGQTLRPEEQ